LENDGYIIVSEVGLIAIGFSNSVSPLLVTHATSGANPSMCAFSFSKALLLTNKGNYAFSTSSIFINSLKYAWIYSHTAYARGRNI